MTFAYQLLQLTQERPAYLEEFEEVLSTIPSSLGLEQEKALTLCLAASPLMVITGVVGSGKTYLVKVLAETLLKADQKFLLLTTSVESVTIYREGLAIFSQIDYLPLGSFPDPLLQKLRSPRKLDKWVNIIERSPETILSTLKEEFPQESLPRLEILAYHLREIAPLLQEQLSLQQVSEGIDKSSSLFTLATIEEFFSLSDNLTKEYKAIIVEDAHTLSLQKISQLARMTDRLILVGDSPLFGSRESDFENLYNRLLPNYRYNLSQQYRLHPFLAEPIFKTLYDDYISSVFQGDRLDLPQLKSRLIWQDVRTDAENDVNPIEGNRLLRFLAQFQNVPAEKIGILTFTSSQKAWLESNYPLSLPRVFIGGVQDYRDKERHLLLVSCVGVPEKMTGEDFAISLTRGLDYLILFGNTKIWQESNTFLSYLLRQPELSRNREVAFG